MNKQQLREQLKQTRLALTSEETQTKSRAIINKLIRFIDWQGVKAIHCFETIAALNEVETEEIFEYIWQEQPQIVTYTSRKIDGKWCIGQVKPDGSFEAQQIELPQFDIVIVPTLGFDKNLNRLGYGGGYYDKFLATQPQAQKIGLCFEIGRTEVIANEEHDIPLDIIITEKQIIKRGS